MRLRYLSIDRDEVFEDVLVKMRRELGAMRLYSYSPPVVLNGNQRVLELKQSLDSTLIVKIDGPEFVIEDLRAHFIKGEYL